MGRANRILVFPAILFPVILCLPPVLHLSAQQNPPAPEPAAPIADAAALFSDAALSGDAVLSGDTAEAQPNALASDQAAVAQRFKKLESLLIKSAEIEAASNPGRSALLQQAAQMGKQSQLTELMARAAKSLEQNQYSQAVEDQKISRDSLKKLLELLQSENRQDRVREQRDQVRRWIEETDRLRRLQSSLRGRTEGGGETEKAASDQQKLAEKASQIAKELSGEDEAADDKSANDTSHADAKPKEGEGKPKEAQNPKDAEKSDDGKPTDGNKTNPQGDEPKEAREPSDKGKPKDDSSDNPKEGEGKPAESQSAKKPSEDKSSESQPSDKPSEAKPSDSKPSDSKPSDSKPSDSKPSDSKPSDSEPSESQNSPSESGESKSGESQSDEQEQKQPPKSPTERATQRIKKAKQRMQEAQKQLKDAERKGAVEKQRAAEQELQAAIEQLEEILRQLREEEIERSLAALEDRLRLMLQSQNKVLEETERLQEIGGESADRRVEIRANSLASDERKILNDGQRALLLLREEGTSAAFPEAMAQILIDIQSVADRLAKADISKLTVSIEKEVVSSLEEMIEALVAVQKDQKQRKEQKQSPGQQQSGEPGEQPLVDQLAEMRLIRTLQLRVNKRTQSLSEVLRDPNDVVGQADAEEIHSQLRGLAERQASIKQVTRDIVVGKTK